VPALTPFEFEVVFGEALAKLARKLIEEYGFEYTLIEKEESDAWIHQEFRHLEDDIIPTAGEHRLAKWEDGWKENLEAFKANPDPASLIPQYFYKDRVNRWRGELIRPAKVLFEYHALCAIEDWIFGKYLCDVDSIYEFGCGTGHNLLRANRQNPKAWLWGLDWTETSWKIIEEMVVARFLDGACGGKFDFFAPDPHLRLSPNSGVYTVAALEQVGTRFAPFVEWLIAQRPKVCVHIEPIIELLDERNLLDRLTMAYMKKRNYLSGFLPYLQEQEKKERIVIHKAQRTHIGGLFTESNSVVVWSPR
jgi:hypothetical protein